MAKESKAKILILSISLLILVTILYSYRLQKGIPDSGAEEGKRTVATVVKETTIRIYDYSSEHISSFIEKQRIKRAERKAEKERKKAEAEKEKFTGTGTNINAIPDKFLQVGADHEYVEIVENIEEEPAQYEIYKSENGNRYIKRLGYYIPGETAEYRYIPIRNEIDGLTFNECEDMVFAAENAPIYGNPKLNGEPIIYAGLNTSFARIGMAQNACYQLVTGDGRIVYSSGKYFTKLPDTSGYKEEITAPSDKALLDVKYIAQNPVLPTGCEVTSLATVLNYYGVEVSKEVLADKYLPKAPIGKADFYVEFVGNPRNSGAYGCYAPAIVKTALDYFAAENISNIGITDYTGSTFSYLLEQVYDGKPVIVWATSPLDDEPVYTTEWNVGGDLLRWKGNLHCLVLIGYDMQAKTITTADPLRGIKEYDINLFATRYKQMYSQAVVVEKIAENVNP